MLTLQLLAIPLYLMLSKRLISKKLNKEIVIFTTYIAAIGILNCIVYNGLIFSTLFQIFFYYCTLCLVSYSDKVLNITRIFIFFNKMFYLQVIAAMIQICLVGVGDNIRGTLISAHYFGVFALVYTYILVKVQTDYFSKLNKALRLLAVVVLFVLADAKHVLGVIVVAYIIFIVFKKLNIKNKVFLFGIVFVFCIMGLLLLFQSSFISDLIYRINLGPYFFNDNYNKKITYIFRTFEAMKSWNGFFGFGVGQFGSQISITVSKGIIYNWDSTLSNYSFAIEPFRNAISGLMTEWYSTYGIGISSMVLGYPLVSFVGMVAELGLVGYCYLLLLFDKFFKNRNVSFIIAFLMLTLFDTYLEIPCVFIMILIATSVCQVKGKMIIKKVVTNKGGLNCG